MKKTIVAAVLSMAILTGCSGRETQESVNNDAVISKMEEMGIIGTVYEGSTSDDTAPAGVEMRGVENFVQITTETGEIYYGAEVNGEIKVWEDGEYNKEILEDADQYTKNTIIQIIPAGEYKGDVTIYLHGYNTQEDTDYVVKEEDGYILNVDLAEGEYDITGYQLADEYEDTYALSMKHFEVSGDQTVVQTEIFKTQTAATVDTSEEN